ncbi:kelch repeat-containing protein [Occallatibacter riparius]|uniref:Chitobiase/beta-hexosaminidase C-terminal domain-containing protein n=1 Tax=Occallatibacter riparius TaxID=1002689 RepID=A0A9J7BQ18_9BACT|nr:kelch repeat-containing protein [Occallatibacter riparius]UWZ84800.1 chitobiase/beta-hexosaminidase C-terminal domain-containing protein [Occallatibacter riparius]
MFSFNGRRPGASLALCLLLFVLSAHIVAFAQTDSPGEWTWVSTPDKGNAPPIYGTLGVPAPANLPPARTAPAFWTDSNGDLWMFGGRNGGVFYNELWKFSMSSRQWAWMGGSQDPLKPGVYGTLGTSDPANAPGARFGAAFWTDAHGKLWMFGGYGLDSTGAYGYLNDLWLLDPASAQWTWKGGLSAFGNNCFTDAGGGLDCSAPPIFGTPGTPAATNTPPGLNFSFAWTDHTGKVWLFGGFGFDQKNYVRYYYNDLWTFDPDSGAWTLQAGTTDGAGSACFQDVNLWYLSCGEPGQYGSLGTAGAGNLPGARSGSTTWVDSAGNLWLFGGQAFDTNGRFSDMNDVWMLNPSTQQWTWMDGMNAVVDYYKEWLSATWGTYGQLAQGNVPPSRWGAPAWKDAQGNIWLFGGIQNGWFGNAGYGWLSDQWKFDPASNQWGWMAGNVNDSFTSISATQGIPGQFNIPASRDGAVIWTDSAGNLWLFGGRTTFDAFNDMWEFQPDNTYRPSVSSPVFSPSQGTYSTPQTVAISASTPGALIYYTTDGTTPSVSSTLYGAPVRVSSTRTLQAIAVAPNYLPSPVAAATFNIAAPGPTPTSTTLSISPASTAFAQQVTLTATVANSGGGSPTGTVTFKTSAKTLGSVPLAQGSAALTVASLPVGSASLTASYSGDAQFAPSTSGAQTALIGTPSSPENQWVWMRGATKAVQSFGTDLSFNYGIRGVPSDQNEPAKRLFPATAVDAGARLWVFGGFGVGQSVNGQLLNDLWVFDPASNQWTWISGGNTVGTACTHSRHTEDICGFHGLYGTRGQAAPGQMPGSRDAATTWFDSQGRLWLFGGEGFDADGNFGELDDMWRFDPATGLWTWIGGSTLLANNGRFDGQDPVFGTLGSPDPANTPGGRSFAATWLDAQGNVWLFGGRAHDVSALGTFGDRSDLWKYAPSANQWTWMGGITDFGGGDIPGAYGTRGVPASANLPGSREDATTWRDASGKFWLFGGWGIDSQGAAGELNDVWRFDPATMQWTWMAGNNLSYGPAVYGTQGQIAPANTPSGRFMTSGWADSAGKFWLWGGRGYDSANQSQLYFNDLWEFDPQSAQWAWIAGEQLTTCPTLGGNCGSAPTYGTPGLPASANIPGGRGGSAVWMGAGDVVWVFGGWGVDPSTQFGFLGDLWKLPVRSAITPATALPAFSVPSGTYTAAQTLQITDATPNAAIYYTTDGSTPSASSTLYTAPLTISASKTIQAIAIAPGASPSAVASASYVIQAPPGLSISAGDATLQPGASATLNVMVLPVNGFTGSVNLAAQITSSPAGAVHLPTLSFGSTSPVNITGTLPANATLTVNTTGPTTVARAHPQRNPWLPAAGSVLGCVLLLGLRRHLRRFRASLALAWLLLAIAGALSGCGGGSGGSAGGGTPKSDPGTSPGKYVITMTATSGTISQTGSITLTVQ